MAAEDMDADGDTDLLVATGDIMDPICQTTDNGRRHGVALLTNDGQGTFERSTIARIYGAYGLQVADLDADGDMDVVASSFQDPIYELPLEDADLVWLENEGSREFATHPIGGAPAGIISVELTDLNADRVPDILVGCMETTVPNPRAVRLSAIHVRRVER